MPRTLVERFQARVPNLGSLRPRGFSARLVMAFRGLVFALAATSAAHGAGSALVEGTTRLTPDTFNGFVQDAIDSGKTAMVRWIASPG